MKILVVEDEAYKRVCIVDFLEARNIEVHWEYSVKPAIRYVIQNPKEISGIILDLGLTSTEDSFDYDWEKGMELVERLHFDKINIPILINSSREIDLDRVMTNYSNVKGQMYEEDDYGTLEEFITLLKEVEQ